jgi:hypothetical protein
MKFSHALFQRFTVYLILLNLCLQSCSGFNKPTVPLKQGSTQPIQAASKVAYNQALIDNKFLSQEGYWITLYPEGAQLRAEVEEKLHHELSQLHYLPVSREQGKIIDQVMDTAIDQQSPLIHAHLLTGEQSHLVYIGNVGLVDGSNTGETKGK